MADISTELTDLERGDVNWDAPLRAALVKINEAAEASEEAAGAAALAVSELTDALDGAVSDTTDALATKAAAAASPPWLHALTSSTIGTRASVVLPGYTGPIVYNLSRFAGWSGTIIDQQVGDIRVRRT